MSLMTQPVFQGILDILFVLPCVAAGITAACSERGNRVGHGAFAVMIAFLVTALTLISASASHPSWLVSSVGGSWPIILISYILLNAVVLAMLTVIIGRHNLQQDRFF